MKHKIFFPIHWKIDNRIKKICGKDSLELYNKKISIVIDHRINKIKLQEINRILKKKLSYVG